jgi:hypothetical protein
VDQRKELLKDELLRRGYRWLHILNRKSLDWPETEMRLFSPVDRSDGIVAGKRNAARAEYDRSAALVSHRGP